MVGIGIATATAGINVGAVLQTGVGLVLADLVEIVSMGNIMLNLIFTAVLSLILGMGLPTTANYIVVSSLMAPVIVILGEQAGLIVPLIAVHLFVFYRSEEHTSELQSLMRISYAVFCLKKKTQKQ